MRRKKEKKKKNIKNCQIYLVFYNYLFYNLIQIQKKIAPLIFHMPSHF